MVVESSPPRLCAFSLRTFFGGVGTGALRSESVPSDSCVPWVHSSTPTGSTVERTWLARYDWVGLGVYAVYLLSTAVRLQRDRVERPPSESGTETLPAHVMSSTIPGETSPLTNVHTGNPELRTRF